MLLLNGKEIGLEHLKAIPGSQLTWKPDNVEQRILLTRYTSDNLQTIADLDYGWRSNYPVRNAIEISTASRTGMEIAVSNHSVFGLLIEEKGIVSGVRIVTSDWKSIPQEITIEESILLLLLHTETFHEEMDLELDIFRGMMELDDDTFVPSIDIEVCEGATACFAANGNIKFVGKNAQSLIKQKLTLAVSARTQ